MEIPCHFSSQIDGSSIQIHTKIHDHSMKFIQVLFIVHAGAWHGFWTSSRHAISWHLPRKWWDFHRKWSRFQPNCRQQGMRKSNHFLGKCHRNSMTSTSTPSFTQLFILVLISLSMSSIIIENGKGSLFPFVYPVKNVTPLFSCLFDGSLVEIDTKSDGNLIIFLGNAMEIPWLTLVWNPGHVPAWTTNKTCLNDMHIE